MNMNSSSMKDRVVKIVGLAIGVLIDVAFMLVIPGSSIVEKIVGLLLGMFAGFKFVEEFKAKNTVEAPVLAT